MKLQTTSQDPNVFIETTTLLLQPCSAFIFVRIEQMSAPIASPSANAAVALNDTIHGYFVKRKDPQFFLQTSDDVQSSCTVSSIMNLLAHGRVRSMASCGGCVVGRKSNDLCSLRGRLRPIKVSLILPSTRRGHPLFHTITSSSPSIEPLQNPVPLLRIRAISHTYHALDDQTLR
jgi:hypothetical protein